MANIGHSHHSLVHWVPAPEASTRRGLGYFDGCGRCLSPGGHCGAMEAPAGAGAALPGRVLCLGPGTTPQCWPRAVQPAPHAAGKLHRTHLAGGCLGSGEGDGICPRDQNILNMLHDEDFLGSLRSLGSLEDGKIMRILPCRWSLFPAVDWHPAWSKPDLWHPELFQRMRYPGLVSSTQVQPKKLIGSTDGGIHAVPRCILQVQLLYIIWQD